METFDRLADDQFMALAGSCVGVMTLACFVFLKLGIRYFAAGLQHNRSAAAKYRAAASLIELLPETFADHERRIRRLESGEHDQPSTLERLGYRHANVG